MEIKNKYCKQEFEYLSKLIDKDDNHKLQLDQKNENCRYANIITYQKNRVALNTTKRYINASWIHLPFK